MLLDRLHRSWRTRALAAALIAVAAAALVLVPAVAATATAGSGASGPPGEIATAGLTFRAPAGWPWTSAPGPTRAQWSWGRDGGSVSVAVTTGVVDRADYAARQARWTGVLDDATLVPAGPVVSPRGLTGPSWTLATGSGRRGRLLVLARGRTVAVVTSLGPPTGADADVVSAATAVVASLRGAP